MHHCTFRSQKRWTPISKTTYFTKKVLFIQPNFRMTFFVTVTSLHILIHHCTFYSPLHVKTNPESWCSSSLHILIHHCTFYAPLHVKTNPESWCSPGT